MSTEAGLESDFFFLIFNLIRSEDEELYPHYFPIEELSVKLLF